MSVDRIILHQRPGMTLAAFQQAGSVVELWVEMFDTPSLVGGIALARGVSAGRKSGASIVALPEGEAFLRDRILDQGELCPVQIVRDATQGKRAVVRSGIELQDGPIVLTVRERDIGVSKKIRAKARREEIKASLEKHVPSGVGMLARSAASALSAEDIEACAARLGDRWKALEAAIKGSDKPVWLSQSPSLEEQARNVAPTAELVVDRTGGLFEEVGGEDALEAALAHRVNVEGGGELVFDRGEAGTLIDVNLGDTNPSKAGKSLEHCAKEVARQMRLRGLRGTILVDFPRSGKGGNRKLLEAALREESERDSAQIHLLGWTPGGMLELVREGVRRPLADDFLEPVGDPVPTGRAAGLAALHGIRGEVKTIARPRLFVSRMVANWLTGPGAGIVDAERRRLGHLSIAIDPTYSRNNFRVEEES